MRNKARLLIIAVVCIVACSGCANRNCSLVNFATEQAESTDQQLKKAAIEQISSSLGNIVRTTVSWSGDACCFLSESAEIEERRVILYNVCGQMDADVAGIIPMSANKMTIYLPIGKDCFVYINRKHLLFPKEVE